MRCGLPLCDASCDTAIILPPAAVEGEERPTFPTDRQARSPPPCRQHSVPPPAAGGLAIRTIGRYRGSACGKRRHFALCPMEEPRFAFGKQSIYGRRARAPALAFHRCILAHTPLCRNDDRQLLRMLFANRGLRRSEELRHLPASARRATMALTAKIECQGRHVSRALVPRLASVTGWLRYAALLRNIGRSR